MYKTFTKTENNYLKQPMFFGENVDVARYDVVKYPFIEKLTNKYLSMFWRPEEINCVADSKDFKALNSTEQHIFEKNLLRQVLLDSIQGRAPTSILTPICSLPELESWLTAWTFSEAVHSRSYTHILRNVYANPSEVFDNLTNNEQIMNCAKDVSYYYDSLHEYNAKAQLDSTLFGDYEHKKRLWLCINAINALEGIRFFVSFACSWAFGQLGKMMGNAAIIELIARDEMVHLGFTQQLLKLLPKDDSDFSKIREDCKDEVLLMFKSVVDQENDWADYLFKDGQIIGLNTVLLKKFLEYIATKRCKAIGIEQDYWNVKDNPLPWVDEWLGGHDVQVAPQELNKTEYLIGEVKNDLTEDSFKNIEW